MTEHFNRSSDPIGGVSADLQKKAGWRMIGVAIGVAMIGLLSAGGVVHAEESESKAQRPNILFAIADDASYPHMSVYGTDWISTPAFDRVANEGLRFDRCYTPNAKCAPSRACILTGKNSWQLGAAGNHWATFPPEQSTFVDVLRSAGYRCGLTGKGWGPGVALDADGKQRQIAGDPISRNRAKPPAGGMGPNDYDANFAEFLSAGDEDQPFCFWYGCNEPHRGYEYGSGVAKNGRTIDQIDAVPAYWPDTETIRNDMLDYAFEIEHFDDHLGRMIDRLEASGQLDNTIIVVTSDNGMPFPRVKGQPYERSHHMPLAIRWPAGIQQPGRVIDDLISFIDFAPTFLELAGVDWSTCSLSDVDHPEPTGHSMTDLFANQPQHERAHVLIGKERHDVGRPGDLGYPIRGIIGDTFLLIRNLEPTRWPVGNPEVGYPNTDGSPTKTQILQMRRDGEEDRYWRLCFGMRPPMEMYNLLVDADCTNNVAKSPRYDKERKDLLKSMNALLIDQNDPRSIGEGDIFMTFPYANSQDRGFYERYLEDPTKVNAGWINPSDAEPDPLPPELMEYQTQ